MKEWCMCTKLQAVARDMYSTCSICGGQDAYGTSEGRPENKRKVVEPLNKVETIQPDCFACGYAKNSKHNYCFNCGNKFKQD